MTVLKSQFDSSVNFTTETSDGGLFECRYVRRIDQYFTLYLSSHSGCNKRCKFCHLTQTNQTMFQHASLEDYLSQANQVLEYYTTQTKAEFVYFSFMARGEPFANKTILNQGDQLLTRLAELAKSYGLKSKFCISTIMPYELRNRELTDIFYYTRPIIYYSVYSLNPSIRQKWIPSSLSPSAAFSKLSSWQSETGMLVKIHGAIIKNVNDDVNTWTSICDTIDQIGLEVKFNLVQYNPFSEKEGLPGDIDLVNGYLLKRGCTSKVKSRVGFDIKASCGMFVER